MISSLNEQRDDRFELNVFPNPLNDRLHIEFEVVSEVRINIFDTIGIKRYGKSVKSEEVITIDFLSPGLYYLQVLDRKGNLLQIKPLLKLGF